MGINPVPAPNNYLLTLVNQFYAEMQKFGSIVQDKYANNTLKKKQKFKARVNAHSQNLIELGGKKTEQYLSELETSVASESAKYTVEEIYVKVIKDISSEVARQVPVKMQKDVLSAVAAGYTKQDHAEDHGAGYKQDIYNTLIEQVELMNGKIGAVMDKTGSSTVVKNASEMFFRLSGYLTPAYFAVNAASNAGYGIEGQIAAALMGAATPVVFSAVADKALGKATSRMQQAVRGAYSDGVLGTLALLSGNLGLAVYSYLSAALGISKEKAFDNHQVGEGKLLEFLHAVTNGGRIGNIIVNNPFGGFGDAQFSGWGSIDNALGEVAKKFTASYALTIGVARVMEKVATSKYKLRNFVLAVEVVFGAITIQSCNALPPTPPPTPPAVIPTVVEIEQPAAEKPSEVAPIPSEVPEPIATADKSCIVRDIKYTIYDVNDKPRLFAEGKSTDYPASTSMSDVIPLEGLVAGEQGSIQFKFDGNCLDLDGKLWVRLNSENPIHYEATKVTYQDGSQGWEVPINATNEITDFDIRVISAENYEKMTQVAKARMVPLSAMPPTPAPTAIPSTEPAELVLTYAGQVKTSIDGVCSLYQGNDGNIYMGQEGDAGLENCRLQIGENGFSDLQILLGNDPNSLELAGINKLHNPSSELMNMVESLLGKSPFEADTKILGEGLYARIGRVQDKIDASGYALAQVDSPTGLKEIAIIFDVRNAAEQVIVKEGESGGGETTGGPLIVVQIGN